MTGRNGTVINIANDDTPPPAKFNAGDIVVHRATNERAVIIEHHRQASLESGMTVYLISAGFKGPMLAGEIVLEMAGEQ